MERQKLVGPLSARCVDAEGLSASPVNPALFGPDATWNQCTPYRRLGLVCARSNNVCVRSRCMASLVCREVALRREPCVVALRSSSCAYDGAQLRGACLCSRRRQPGTPVRCRQTRAKVDGPSIREGALSIRMRDRQARGTYGGVP